MKNTMQNSIPHNPWKTISSKTVYNGRYIKVREDLVIRPDGKRSIYAFVQVPRTVGVVPVDGDSNVYLCKQFRYIFQDESWEIPRGFVDRGETVQEAARRELKEEAGLETDTLQDIGKLRLSIGLIDEEAKLYLAYRVFSIQKYDKNEVMEVKKFSLPEALKLIDTNEIKDGLTIGAVLRVRQILEQK